MAKSNNLQSHNAPILLVRKISPKTLCGKLPKPTQTIHLYDVYGTVTAYEKGEVIFGSGKDARKNVFYKFRGSFVAVRPDGARAVCSVAFFNAPVDSIIVTALESGNVQAMNVAIRVSIDPSDNSPVGYTYRSEVIPGKEKLSDLIPAVDMLALPPSDQ